MDPLSITVGAASLATLCIRTGKVLITKYQSYQHAEHDILELLLRVEHHWLKTEIQVEFLQNIWSDFGEQLQVHQNGILRVLYIKLNEAILLVDQVIGDERGDNASLRNLLSKKGGFRKAKFALKVKDCLQKTLDDLAMWQEMLDPSWFLMTRIPSSAIDKQLNLETASVLSSATTIIGIRDELHATDNGKNDAIFVAAETLIPERTLVPFSFSRVSRDRKTLDSLLVDTLFCTAQTQMATITQDIGSLARVLSKIDPLVFGLLSCRGVIKRIGAINAESSFEFVFSIPHHLRMPTSLRGILIEGNNTYPLNDRLNLAKQIANSVLFIHNAGFVHKSMRPETILVFASESSALQHSFLVGFEKFRPADQISYRVGDRRWERNLYQHPKRQGLVAEEDFIMQHDIYSLGVCLLEIGMWTSFVEWGGTSPDAPTFTPNNILRIDDLLELKDDRKRASEIKKILIRLAEERLPSLMGTKYTQIVVACLTCLDKGSDVLGDESEFLDDDGILVAVRYIEMILMRIKEISV